jgi:hypothetical protein
MLAISYFINTFNYLRLFIKVFCLKCFRRNSGWGVTLPGMPSCFFAGLLK